jgi:hypothetical protein
VIDPITGQGIGDAFRDAELLAGAVGAGLGGGETLEAALAGYRRQRPGRDPHLRLHHRAGVLPPASGGGGQAVLRPDQGRHGHTVTQDFEVVTI